MSGEGGFESDFFTHPSLRGDTDVNPEVTQLVPGLQCLSHVYRQFLLPPPVRYTSYCYRFRNVLVVCVVGYDYHH
jgi:hypothetical protein